jgi:hypothetical protein
VLWEDVKKTGGVVSCVTVTYYLMEHSGSTLIALLCKLLMSATIFAYLFTHANTFLKWCATARLREPPLSLSHSQPSLNSLHQLSTRRHSPLRGEG